LTAKKYSSANPFWKYSDAAVIPLDLLFKNYRGRPIPMRSATDGLCWLNGLFADRAFLPPDAYFPADGVAESSIAISFSLII
jgi:hypothetical protein